MFQYRGPATAAAAMRLPGILRDAVAKAVDRTLACTRNHFNKRLWLGGELFVVHHWHRRPQTRPPRPPLRLRRPTPRPRGQLQPPSQIEDPRPVFDVVFLWAEILKRSGFSVKGPSGCG